VTHRGIVGRIAAPILGALNVEPDHAKLGTFVAEFAYKGLNLTSAITAFVAREDVCIDVFESDSPSILDVGHNVRVKSTDAAVASRNEKSVTLVFKASECRC